MKYCFNPVFLALFSVFLLTTLLTACDFSLPGEPTLPILTSEPTAIVEPTLPPISSVYDEATIRYILADSQLGVVIDYYRQFPNQPNVAEAVCRWDNSVRVQNLSNFERKIVGDQGWKVVYAGTENAINGLDVVLSSNDTCALSSEGDPTQYFCNNPYWPLISGAYWNYDLARQDGGDHSSFGSRIEVPVFDTNSNSLTLLGNSSLGVLTCTSAGIEANILDLGEGLLLPAIDSIYDGMTWSTGNANAEISFDGETLFVIFNGGEGISSLERQFVFIKGIGLQFVNIPGICMMCNDQYYLKDYFIPK